MAMALWLRFARMKATFKWMEKNAQVSHSFSYRLIVVGPEKIQEAEPAVVAMPAGIFSNE